ncbi:MAG TPA: zinc metallopeptidase, partial [Pirellulaceae bacterium]
MFFDPKYILFVVLPGLVLSGFASWLVKSAFNKYSRVATRRGITGAEAAKRVLDQAGIHDV